MISAVRDTLVGLPAYEPLRFVYQALFDREAVFRRKRRIEFYSTFIRPRDLVFDVGANLGNYAEALCQVGAAVIAIEPDPHNLKILAKRLRYRNVHIEPCAIGKTEGTAHLHVAADRRDASTISAQWAKRTNARWQGTVKVPLRTLDSIAKEHGTPEYVKVDAEGYDAEVLRGMSFRPRMLSFEFLSADLNVAQECIRLLREWSFNCVLEERSRFELSRWVTSDDITSLVSGLSERVAYGDIFAKAPGT